MKVKNFILLLIILSLQVVLAQEEISAGIMPDSVFYGLDKAFDRISFILTFDKAARAEKGLRLAQERLLEAKEMIERGKIREAMRAQKGYERIIEETENVIESIKSGEEENRARKVMEKIARIQNMIENHYQKVVEVKDFILERQKQRMSEEQISKLEDVFSKIKEKVREIEIKLDLKRRSIRERYKVLSGKDDEEVSRVEKEIDEKVGLFKGRLERAKKELSKVKEKVEKKKKKGVDVKEVEERVKKLEKKIKQGRDLRDFGKEVSVIARELKDKEEGFKARKKTRQSKKKG